MRVRQLSTLRMGLQQHRLFLLAILATWQVAETEPVLIIDGVKLTVLPGQHVTSGTNVTLQCEPKIVSSTGTTLTYQYTFYREGSVAYTRNTDTATPLPYHIPQARVAHSGWYKCSVSVLGLNQESDSKSLNVSGLQTPILSLNKTLVTEGEKVTAFCRAPSETGTFYFYFFEGKNELQKVHSYTNEAKVELKFKQQGKKSLYCDYGVDLQPGFKRSDQSRKVDIFVQELSIRPTIEIIPRKNVIEGDTVNITCDVSHSQIMVYLSKGTDLKASGKGSLFYTMKVRSDDAGKYECKSSIGTVMKTISSTVEVSELFSVPVLKMERQEVFEKEPFALTCYSDNISIQRISRRDIKYSLYYNGRVLMPGNPSGKYSTTASTSLNGNYSCDAVASTIRKSSNVIVFKAKVLVSKPLISVPGKVIVGRPFQIRCHCENGSLPISYTLLNNKLPQRPIMIVRQPNSTALFTVTIKKTEEIKNFTCEAENNPSFLKKESDVLNVTVIEPVSDSGLLIMPGRGEVTEGEQLFLVCSVGAGSPLITFKWYRHGSEQALHTKVSKKTSDSFVLPRASSEYAGTYYCVADNAANHAVPSNTATINVSLARWKKVLIGASCILLVMILIGVGCYFYRAERGKRETATELSVKPPSPKSEDSLTVNLAHDTEVYSARKDSADVRGRSVWSERESDSDSNGQSAEESPKEPDVQYTEVVHPQAADGIRAPVKKGTDTVYSELQNSPQGVADQSGYGSVEYAQLNHDLPQPV